MKIKHLLIFAFAISICGARLHAAESDFEDHLDQEVNSVDPISDQSKITETDEQKTTRIKAEEEMKRQEDFARSKRLTDAEIKDRNNRYPTPDPIFVKPVGPKEGGVLRVPHPRAANGLMRIESDGTYHYQTKLKDKSQAASFKITSMAPPVITNESSNVSYDSMYGSGRLIGALFEYEWQPFRGFGSLGLLLGTGISTAHGNGTFRRDGSSAQETYNLYIIPLTAFLNYRFEYVKRQLFVPFINGGATYYGMMELRDDGKKPAFAGAPAVGGGGGIHISISRLDPAGAFTMSEEYNIADMWLTLEARVMQGLYKDTDFTSQSINVGFTVDY